MGHLGVLALALVIGFPGAAVGQPAADSGATPPSGERLAADTAMATAGGATFTAPVGWSVTSGTNKIVLDPPEADSRLALVDVQAPDAAAAVAAGWASYRPDANRPLRLATPQAPYNGWEERHILLTRPRPMRRQWSMHWPGGRAGIGRSPSSKRAARPLRSATPPFR